MQFSQTRRRRAAFLISCFVVVGLATEISVRLAAYGVPATFLVACGMGVASSGLFLVERLATAASTTTYRCPSNGCDFKVTLTRVSAAEDRRWQETAATHPHRYQH